MVQFPRKNNQPKPIQEAIENCWFKIRGLKFTKKKNKHKIKKKYTITKKKPLPNSDGFTDKFYQVVKKISNVKTMVVLLF